MTCNILFLAAALGLAATLAHAQPVDYAVDPNHSAVTWEALHLGTSTLRGQFHAREGTIAVDRTARTGRAEVTIDLTSLSGPVKHLDNTLRGERAFNMAPHPTARFASESFALDAGGKVATVPGVLTVMGRSHPVTLRAVRFNCCANPMLQGREVYGGDFETTISRSAIGLGFSPQSAADEVRLLVQVEAVRRQP